MLKERLVIGITGASGASLAVALLQQLKRSSIESHVVCSHSASITLTHECGLTLSQLKQLCDVWYDYQDIGAAIASGSFYTMGMVVIPCSMKSLAGIISGYSDNLLLRAADVTLKERRKLVLVPRECPFSTLHLRNLTIASELGALIVPPVPAYYTHPANLDDINECIAKKILALLGARKLDAEWEGLL